jgi:hypothetical protein
MRTVSRSVVRPRTRCEDGGRRAAPEPAVRAAGRGGRGGGGCHDVRAPATAADRPGHDRRPRAARTEDGPPLRARGSAFEQVDQRFEHLEQLFDRRFELVHQRFEEIDRRFGHVDDRFTTLQRELEVRLDGVRDELLAVFRGELVTAVSGQTRAMLVAVVTTVAAVGGLAVALTQVLVP